MTKPRALIFSGYGLNCEEETCYAFQLAGARAEIVHVNDLIDKRKRLSEYQILAVPGGFSYGDDTGSGNAYAGKLRNHLWSDMETFLKKKGLIIGICNGFQILSNLGLLPAIGRQYGKREIGLIHNTSARYTVRWVDVKVENESPWLRDVDAFSVAIAHGEGRLYASEETIQQLHRKKLIALRYIKGAMCRYQDLPANPNGSTDDVAGITDETGRIFGLMPHPERAMFFAQHPDWPRRKEQYLRAGKPPPEYGPGLKIFQNAVQFFHRS